MKGKQLFWPLLGVIIVMAVILGLINRSNNPANTNVATNTTTTNRTNTNASRVNSNASTININTALPGNINTSVNTNTAKTVSVSAAGNEFVPKNVTINVGDTVVWTNNSIDSVYVAPNSHPIHRDYAGIWDDDGRGQIDPGESYSHTFTVAGTYQYHDHPQPSINGTVTVQ